MTVQNIKSLSSHLKHCTDNERLALLSAIRQNETYLRVLNAFAVSVIQISNYDDLVWYVAKEVVARLGFVDCVIYKYEPATKMLQQQAAIGEKNPEGRTLLNPLNIPLGTGVTGRVAKSMEPLVIGDLSKDVDYVEDISPALSEICVPLEYAGELLGVIDCEDPRRHHFTEQHLEILTAVASMASSKIKECEVVRILQEQAEVMSCVREAVVVSDVNGVIVENNSGAERLYGYTREQMVGKGVEDFMEDGASWKRDRQNKLKQLAETGGWRGPVRVRKHSGEIITIDLSITPLMDDSGVPIATVGVGRDITSLVKAERELKEKNVALLQKQEELEKALRDGEAARVANRAKDTFLANTNHELRTPLTGVIGMIDLLEKTDLSPEQRELASVAGKSASTLLCIINDVLDLAKMEAGKIILQEEPFNPASAISSAAETMRAKAEAKGLEYNVTVPLDLSVQVKGDINRIHQILFNLVGNAIKFTDKGHVDVALDLQNQGDYALFNLEVSDTGSGFTEEAARRIFGRFEQLDASSSKSAEGSGLGLAISRELAALMGGIITAKSTLGEGTTFKFRAKLKRAATVLENTEDVPAKDSGKKAQGRVLEILVAEDNIVNQMLITKLIERFGWTPTVVGNGRDAVAALEKENSYDIVLMDIRMPLMDGLTATKAIRSKAGNAGNIPIVALTANALPADKEEYLLGGMDDVVAKPIDKENLRSTILEWVK